MKDSEKVQHTEPNAALITPSASPPRSRLDFAQRIRDHPSPTKRPRLSPAPRQVQQRASSSSSTPTDTINFHKAREESAMRLLDVWAGLAERYSRPLDGDDIIDITTGKVVKDRGVLRGSQTFTIGAFGDPTPEDAEDELEEDDEEDDIDELDTFANPALRDIDASPLVDIDAPPLVDIDARDAQDLKEFLEAEEKRREIYGSEADETEGSIYESLFEEAPVEESDRDASQEGPEGDRTPDRPSEPIYVDSGSEDELGGWDLNEGSVIYRLPKEEDSDSEVEILDKTTQPNQLSPEFSLPPWISPEPVRQRGGVKKSNRSHQRQLQTPPQSHSSGPSATPDVFLSQSPPTSPLQSSSQYDSSPIKPRPAARGSKKPTSGRKQTSPLRAQLKHPSLPIPRLDLKKVLAESPVKSKHGFQTSSTQSLDSQSTKRKKKRKTMSVETEKEKLEQLASNVEAAIRRRTPSRQGNNMSIERKPCPTAKEKGKQKTASPDQRPESLEEDLPRQSSSLTSKSGSSRSRSRQASLSSTTAVSRVLPGDVPSSSRKPKSIPLTTQPGSTSGKKRKRFVSSAETLEETRALSPEPSIEDIQRNSSTSRLMRQSSDASDSPETLTESNPSSRRREKRKHNPRRRSHSAGSEFNNASQEEEVEQGQRHSSRAPSHFNAPYYPYPPPLYPHHPPDQQPMYIPLQDPRAQYIFTQAMQQIFSLGSGTWGPPPLPARGSTPFTPTRHRRHHGDPRPSPPMYSTPVHHPHPYPYSYDPMLSNATLPPQSPEVPSSPGMSASGAQRKKSLVKRSQSRGRRVSFREEVSDLDALGDPDTYSEGAGSPCKRHASRFGSQRHESEPESRKKGKGKARDEPLMSGSEAESEPASKPRIPTRGRPSTRHQTPGPSSREQDSALDTRRVAHQSRNKSRA